MGDNYMPDVACSCGAVIPVKKPGMPGNQARWCSRQCWQRDADARRKAKRDAALAARTCPVCRGAVSIGLPAHAVYCSAACKNSTRRLPPAGHGICPCGAEFEKVRKDARFCSIACDKKAHRDNAARQCATAGCDKPCRAKGLCSGCYNKTRRAVGLDVQPWNDRKRDHYHRRRAMKKTASLGRPVLASDIYERDGGRCHLCRKAVPDVAWPHPLSPSLDHVVPLSKGGAHDPSNVKLAHLACNTAKGNRGGNEQLLLIG